MNEVKLCECGCGQPTKIAARTDRTKGKVKGQPNRCLPGHSPARSTVPPPIPASAERHLCECGCGEPAPIAKQTDSRLGYVRGGPKRFLPGHQSRNNFPSPEERFWSHVQKTESCWRWTGTRVKGYGVIYANGKLVRAHRFSYTLNAGAVPEKLWILHHCDNPLCVRPDHLYAGTHAQNVQDAIARDRLPKGERNGSRLHPERRPRGDKHWTHNVDVMPTAGENGWNSKLTDDDVRMIRSLYASGRHSQSQLGVLFGTTQTNIGRIVRRLAWKHVE